MVRHPQLRWALMILILAMLAGSLAARPRVVLGPSDGIALDQPRVGIDVYEMDPSYHSFISEYSFYSYLLDTGANGILITAYAAQDMYDNGFQVEAKYDEMGVAGTAELDVSAPYYFAFGGSDGIGDILTDARLLTNPSSSLFFGFGGIVGMPAMVEHIVNWDLEAMGDFGWDWELGADEFSLGMGTYFLDTIPGSSGHRYSISLQMVEFEQTGRRDPCDPAPTWAPLPFVEAKLYHQNRWVSGEFLLDSGAQLSIISTEVAIGLGLDTNGNGEIDFVTEAADEIEISGLGGSVLVPVVVFDGLQMPTEQGESLTWTDMYCAVVDIEGIAGIIGMELFTSGWVAAVFGEGPDGFINQAYLDFRQTPSLTAVMHLDLNPDHDIVTIAEPNQAPSYDMADFAILNEQWSRSDCTADHWCYGADLNRDGAVDAADAVVLSQYWLARSGVPAIIFDLPGLARFANQWLDNDCTAHDWCDSADYNTDGAVNLHDYEQFSAGWFDPGP